MKYLMLVPLLAVAAFIPRVHAAQHTVTLGYAKGVVSKGDDLKGVNAKYRYEWDSPLSIIGSLTYLSADIKEHLAGYNSVSEDYTADVKAYSLTAGPAWRFNDYFSLYSLVGLTHIKSTAKSVGRANNAVLYSHEEQEARTSFVYGAGVQVNVWQNVTLDVGYEGTRVYETNVNGFNVGVGYRF